MPRYRRQAASRDSSPGEEEAPETSGIVSSLEEMAKKGPLPGVCTFDLDYTLWLLWVDTHVSSPLRRKGNALNKVVDTYGEPLSFFPHVPSILFFCRRHGIKVAAASRTSAPTAARQALNGLYLINDGPDAKRNGDGTPRPVKAWDLFDFTEIYPGSKLTHLRRIEADSGIDSEQTLLFDDEMRNAEVGKLGVHFVEVGHQGLDVGTFIGGIAEWRAKMAARSGKDADMMAKV